MAEEVKDLGGQNVQVHKRSVACEGDLAFLYKANYNLRLALKILVPVYEFQARNEQQLYDQVMKHDWSKYLKLDQTFAIDNTVFSEYFRHSKYAALKTKDAIDGISFEIKWVGVHLWISKLLIFSLTCTLIRISLSSQWIAQEILSTVEDIGMWDIRLL